MEEKVRKGILLLYISDGNPVGNIPIDILKLLVDIHFSNLIKI